MKKTNRLLFSISQGRAHTYRLFALCKCIYVHVGKVNTTTCGGILTFSRGDEYAHRSPSGTWCWFSQQLHQCRLGLWTMSLGNCHWSMFCQIGVRCAICSGFPFGWLGTFPAFVAAMQINDKIREQSRLRSGERPNERQCIDRKHLQYVAFYWLTKDWPTHCGKMVLHLVLGMLEKLVDDSLDIRDMVNHAAK